jgi:hypothetical protein
LALLDADFDFDLEVADLFFAGFYFSFMCAIIVFYTHGVIPLAIDCENGLNTFGRHNSLSLALFFFLFALQNFFFFFDRGRLPV